MALSLALAFSGVAVAQDTNVDANQMSSSKAIPAKSTKSVGDWHVASTSSLLFSGMSGGIATNQFAARVHATTDESYDYGSIGLLESIEASKGRLVFPIEFLWLGLSDNNAISQFPYGGLSVKARVAETVLTPQVGYVLADHERFKLSGNAGFRYWHVQNTLDGPIPELYNLYGTANWVDAVGGAKIDVPIFRNADVSIYGDAGGGGADLDYQVGGLLSYKIKPKWRLVAGWRYLDVNYHNAVQFKYDAHQNVLQMGATYHFK